MKMKTPFDNAMLTTATSTASASSKPIDINDMLKAMAEMERLRKPACVLFVDSRLEGPIRSVSKPTSLPIPPFSGVAIRFFGTFDELMDMLADYLDRIVRVVFADGRDIEGSGRNLRQLLVQTAMRHRFAIESASPLPTSPATGGE